MKEKEKKKEFKRLLDMVYGIGTFYDKIAIGVSAEKLKDFLVTPIDNRNRGIHRSVMLHPDDDVVPVWMELGWVDVSKTFLEAAFKKFGKDLYDYIEKKKLNVRFRKNDRKWKENNVSIVIWESPEGTLEKIEVNGKTLTYEEVMELKEVLKEIKEGE